MDYKELNEALAALDQAMITLEETYIENEGEVTEETEAMEARIGALKALIANDGVDMLGRWLKGKEDRKKALKAEKDYITRQMAALDNTMEFVKAKVAEVLKAVGVEKIKGNNGYSFAAYTSVTTSVDKDVLKDMYMEKVEKKLRGGKRPVIPADVTITLGASIKALPDGAALPAYYNWNESDAVRFTKPRAAKE